MAKTEYKINPRTGLPFMHEFFVDKGMEWEDYMDFLHVENYGRWASLMGLTDDQLLAAMREATEWVTVTRTNGWARGDKKHSDRYTLAVALQAAMDSEWRARGLHRPPSESSEFVMRSPGGSRSPLDEPA